MIPPRQERHRRCDVSESQFGRIFFYKHLKNEYQKNNKEGQIKLLDAQTFYIIVYNKIIT